MTTDKQTEALEEGQALAADLRTADLEVSVEALQGALDCLATCETASDFNENLKASHHHLKMLLEYARDLQRDLKDIEPVAV